MTNDDFIQQVWSFYRDNSRNMPWREAELGGTFDPYKILVSEYMLQQTQVDRVVPKFESFISTFPSLETLAQASFSAVLEQWAGLGYNRRAKYLHEAAMYLANKPFPTDSESLTALKGIGNNTAAAILVYSFNQVQYFVETNIRTVYIHHFFPHEKQIDDEKIREKLAATISTENPREFYWALMDYGSFLKKSGVRNNIQSKHYSKQAPFNGSTRQLRGEVLRRAQTGISLQELRQEIDDDRLDAVLQALQQEKLIRVTDGRLSV